MTETFHAGPGLGRLSDVTIIHGNCIAAMRAMPANSIDAIVTDPPYGLGFMGKVWDALPPGEEWARECLRVLKPGGHLLAFGGTRTWHRLAVAVEDAGFEIRDSIAWLYGSGFPKSLDVSKAIDKAAGATREVAGVNSEAKRRNPNGVGGNMRLGGCSTVAELEALASIGADTPDGRNTARATLARYRDTAELHSITAPATPEAEQWSGWGTALKPAWEGVVAARKPLSPVPSLEPVVVARKPLASAGTNVLARVELSLREQGFSEEIRWTRRSANGAVKPGPQTSSSSTEPPATAETSADPVAARETQNGERLTANDSALNTEPGRTPTGSTSDRKLASTTGSSGTPCSTHTAGSAPAAASGSTSSSPSTTSTEAVQLTESPSTARSTDNFGDRGSLLVTESFAGIATGLTTSKATVRIDRLSDGTFVWPDDLPQYVKGGPLTVAANVLAHGTGAINIDATRIGTGGQLQWEKPRDMGYHGGSDSGTVAALESTKGRWPANVVLDADQAAVLDQMSGTSKSPTGTVKQGGRRINGGKYAGDMSANEARNGEGVGYGDSGGASRYFFVADDEPCKVHGIKRCTICLPQDSPFRYVAKAPKKERPVVDGVAHPTVKPLALMRWLVRLVTPPGGVVLDPFAGSGTTVEAALLEDFRVIGIEREADYLPMIQQRIARCLNS